MPVIAAGWTRRQRLLIGAASAREAVSPGRQGQAANVSALAPLPLKGWHPLFRSAFGRLELQLIGGPLGCLAAPRALGESRARSNH